MTSVESQRSTISGAPPAEGRRGPHILIYEPRVEGHHVGNLRFVTEDFLNAGFRLTLAIDTRPDSFRRVREQMGTLFDRVHAISAPGEAAQPEKNKVAFLADCVAQGDIDFVYLNNFDEIASFMLRRAALGMSLPPALRGRLGGVYSRPRFLLSRGLSLNAWSKYLGFSRLLRQGWFRPLLFPDPYLHQQLQKDFPGAPVFFIPDPIPDNFGADRAAAQRLFEIPDGRRVFLFYGGPYRRKGLHLAVQAMLEMPAGVPVVLLCVGEQPKDSQVSHDLEKLAAQGRARVINRYVSTDEEKLAFAATDFVLLPYIRHFGSSGVLARAVGAGKPVIASDEQLVGRLVRERGLGTLFETSNAAALRHAIERAAVAPAADIARWQAAAKVYSETCSRSAYRAALVHAFTAGVAV